MRTLHLPLTEDERRDRVQHRGRSKPPVTAVSRHAGALLVRKPAVNQSCPVCFSCGYATMQPADSPKIAHTKQLASHSGTSIWWNMQGLLELSSRQLLDSCTGKWQLHKHHLPVILRHRELVSGHARSRIGHTMDSSTWEMRSIECDGVPQTRRETVGSPILEWFGCWSAVMLPTTQAFRGDSQSHRP